MDKLDAAIERLRTAAEMSAHLHGHIQKQTQIFEQLRRPDLQKPFLRQIDRRILA